MNFLDLNKKTGSEQEKMAFEGKLDYNERRSLDMMHQLLSDSSNVYQEEKNMFDLFRIYGKILTRWTNNSNFSQSIDRSIQSLNKTFVKTQDEIRQLENNNANSFLIKPLRGIGHRFATVVRKKEGDYSFTLVNKGLRPDYQFEEFLIPIHKLQPLLSTLEQINANVPTEKIYTTFGEYAQHNYKLNIKSRNQKTGNCFIKNPENAIKFAYATRDFSEKDFQNLRINEPSKTFSPKWGVTTGGVHRLFKEQLQKENPRISLALENIFQTYNRNKLFRENLESGSMSIEKSLKMAFDPFHNTSENTRESYIRLISQINIDTAYKSSEPILDFFRKLDDSGQLTNQFLKVARLKDSKQVEEFFQNENFLYLQRTFEFAGSNFPVLCDNVKRELHGRYIQEAIHAMEAGNLNKAIDYSEKSNELYLFNSRAHSLEGSLHFALGMENKSKNLQKSQGNLLNAIHSFTTAIEHNPWNPDLYYQRGEVYANLGEKDLSKRDMDVAQRLNQAKYLDQYPNMDSNFMSQLSKDITRKNMEEIKSQIGFRYKFAENPRFKGVSNFERLEYDKHHHKNNPMAMFYSR